MTDDNHTTVRLSSETKELLDQCKLDGETYNEALGRLLTENGILWTEQEVREIARDEAGDILHEVRR